MTARVTVPLAIGGGHDRALHQLPWLLALIVLTRAGFSLGVLGFVVGIAGFAGRQPKPTLAVLGAALNGLVVAVGALALAGLILARLTWQRWRKPGTTLVRRTRWSAS